MPDCVTWQLVQRRDRGEAPPWDLIRRTPGWDVVHAFGTAVEGWIFTLMGVGEDEAVPADRMNEIASRLDAALTI